MVGKKIDNKKIAPLFSNPVGDFQFGKATYLILSEKKSKSAFL